MKIEVGDNYEIILKEVFSSVNFVSESGEVLNISMRDSGFEIFYEGYWWEAKEGEIFMSKPTIAVPTENNFTGV